VRPASSGCQTGELKAFYKTYKGAVQGCNKNDVITQKPSNSGACSTTPTIPATQMSQFSDQVICKTVGGQNFLNVQRPSTTTGKCPGTTVPCSNKTSTDNTVCYEPADIAT
jgi:hypothetical protein